MSSFNLNRGALAPVGSEKDELMPEVIGRVPDGLSGTLLRNGPNPFSGQFTGQDVLDWWPEAAMLHGVSFRNGQVTTYRNRWLRTRAWAHATAGSDAESSADSLADTNPNVSVIQHAGEILALAEGGPPMLINDELQSLGLSRRHPGIAGGMTAHPKIDSASGELVAFRQDWAPPFLKYWVMDAEGDEVVSQVIEMSSPSMMHDFAITESSSIFFDLNVSLDISMLAKGVRMPIRWYEDRQARLGVIDRYGGDVTWMEIDPCFVQHVVNAYDEGESISVVDVVRYPWYFQFDADTAEFEPNPLGILWRYRIDRQKGVVSGSALDDLAIELPRINEARIGHLYRYCYAVVQPSDQEMRGVVKYDLHTGNRQCYDTAPGDQNSEPVFVPDPQGCEEDSGWLMVCVYRHRTDTTEVHILDAQDISQQPIAVVRLKSRIPAGFHGAWIGDA